MAAAVGAFAAAEGQPAGSCCKACAEAEVKINNTTNKSKSNRLCSAQLCPGFALVTPGCSPCLCSQRRCLGPTPSSVHVGFSCQPPAGTGGSSRLCSLHPGECEGRLPCSRLPRPPQGPFPGALPEHPPARGICRGYGAGERRVVPAPPGLRARTSSPRTPSRLRRPPGRQ